MSRDERQTTPTQAHPSPADSPEDSKEYEAQLRTFDKALQAGGFTPSSTVWLIEAAGNEVAPYIGVFNVAMAVYLLAPGAVVGAWLKERYGRTVELEVRVKAKARSLEEVRALMEIAQEFKDRNEQKRFVDDGSFALAVLLWLGVAWCLFARMRWQLPEALSCFWDLLPSWSRASHVRATL